MNNSATTRRISKIALEYNGNDKGTAEMVYSNNLLSNTAENQYKEMKAIANRNKNVKNWALTGYISPERSKENEISDEILVKLTLKALQKVGVTKDNQVRLDIHNSTKHKHIHFIVNRVSTHGVNTIKAHKIGENFGKAVREICTEMNLKTDVEISKEKKEKMFENLQNSLKTATNFEELIEEMDKKGYKITLSENVKVGVSGMRIVKHSDINTETKREYLAGYKLSEITNKLKIKNIKEILEQNKIEKVKKNQTEFSFSENKKEELSNSYRRKF
ncbi:relaxase/mobilization nuclease domain-containing protein [Bergeyella zoohelcum]|uniref:relaxase/mobilization nuclease domain-containing protein n=1 Tax=Bergeyella zoohelcum TaxID=1015 RepID=UPI002A9176C0|nr:relaxase/mobilization nuclease domain-containing protein [Bergeyella zoohelcum]MDY6026173.1 relaxase/mobilization nuclease domain-containing protein [Bergeyella zoohelcum]